MRHVLPTVNILANGRHCNGCFVQAGVVVYLFVAPDKATATLAQYNADHDKAE